MFRSARIDPPFVRCWRRLGGGAARTAQPTLRCHSAPARTLAPVHGISLPPRPSVKGDQAKWLCQGGNSRTERTYLWARFSRPSSSRSDQDSARPHDAHRYRQPGHRGGRLGQRIHGRRQLRRVPGGRQPTEAGPVKPHRHVINAPVADARHKETTEREIITNPRPRHSRGNRRRVRATAVSAAAGIGALHPAAANAQDTTILSIVHQQQE